ncbi:cytochrome P450 [Undibacterium seohonense]|uniref:Cytochrome P450 n=1 Tax=Undibacterium seohonense TaxID=1344950 RepID=A0ABR6X122_9BURK|nr:cytochrome P450 [Undibacterium seohonense]MBC3806517.1 cytochrome P450 [Undibacterium seohonense]
MDFATRIKTWATNNLAFIFGLLRTFKPNLIIKEFALITRFSDVQEALSRPDALGVTYAEKMGKITGGSNFFLGMNDTPTYTRDVSNMRLVARRDDVAQVIAPMVEKFAQQLVAKADGKIEMVSQLSSIVPCQFSAEYLGVAGPSQQELFDSTSSMFAYLFYPDNPDEVDQAALANSVKTCAYLDQLIAQRKQEAADGQVKDDIIGRCLKLQASGTPGMSDLEIRNNIIGIIIGLMPTTSKCAVLVIDYLLDHPELLAGAQQAALANDDETLRKTMLEALRFNSFGAGVFRIANEDYVIASGSFRSKKIPKGSKVLVALQSAMLDGRELDDPKSFRLDRPDYQYMHFGYGMHTCFGQYINMVQIPMIVKALLRCKNLRRAAGDAGKVKYQQAFPVSLHLEFDQS